MIYDKVFILEVTGPTIDFIQERLPHLPNIRHFMECGAWARLIGPMQPHVTTSFSTLITGKNPGKTGLFGPYHFSRGKNRLTPCGSHLLKEQTIFQTLSTLGKQIGLVNVPFVDPSKPFNGFLVSGDENIGDVYAAPRAVLKDLQYDGYVVPFGASYAPGRELSFFRHAMDMLSMRRRAFRSLFSKYKWDFGMLTLFLYGELLHAFWKFYDPKHPKFRHYSQVFRGHDPFLQVLKNIDEILGEISKLSGPNALVIFMGAWGHRLEHSRIYLNTALEKGGFLRFKSDMASRLKKTFFQFGFTPQRMEQLAHRLDLYRRFHYGLAKGTRTAVKGSTFLSYQDVDWEHTQAVAIGYLGQVYMTQNQQASNAFNKLAYLKRRGRLINFLEGLKDPSGKTSVFSRVLTREEIFSGPYLIHAPDLYAECRLGYSADSSMSCGDRWLCSNPEHHSSEHWNESVFMAMGKGILGGQVTARLEDIAPTILHAYGLKPPRNCDGRVLPIFQ
jgi:predicted AlkP superfamily phosphohydrolase/phosphomutase